MTYWYHAYCMDCKVASPSLFVTFNDTLKSALRYGEAGRSDPDADRAGAWLEEHCAPGHDVRLVHENDGNSLRPPKFPGPAEFDDESR